VGNLTLGANVYSFFNLVLNSDGSTTTQALKSISVRVGDSTDILDASANFVYINAPTGTDIGYVRGPNRANGTLQLGANSSQLSNIVLNADGTTTISNPLILSYSELVNRHLFTGPISYPSLPWKSGFRGGPPQYNIRPLDPGFLNPGFLSTLGSDIEDLPPSAILSLTNIIAKYSILQVNITFDAVSNNDIANTYVFSLLADNYYPSNNVTRFITIPPYPSFYTVSFIMFKGNHYNTSTKYLQFSSELYLGDPNPAKSINLGNYQYSYTWELFGIV
jgi:hypothetical protein